jgi:hypothetical protein
MLVVAKITPASPRRVVVDRMSPPLKENTPPIKLNRAPSFSCMQDTFDPVSCQSLVKEKRKVVSGVTDVPLRKILAIDIEGQVGNEVELAWVLYDPDTKRHTAKVCHTRPKDIGQVRREAEYCHGIDVKKLLIASLWDRQDVLLEVREMCRDTSDVIVISADEGSNSDIARLTAGWGINYINVPLTKWCIRPSTNAHKLARELQSRDVVSVYGAVCQYMELHSVPIRKKKSEPQGLGHCALIDAFEVIQHVMDNQLERLISRAFPPSSVFSDPSWI